MKTLVLIILAGLILGGCTLTGSVAEVGDTVTVNYVGKLEDGSVFDTNVRDVAENPVIRKAETWRPHRVYVPLKFTAGAGEMIQGFDEGVIGLKEGETRTIEIPPEKAYGEKDPQLMKTYPRRDRVEVVEQIWVKEFEESTGLNATTLKKNQIIPWRYWNARILLVTDENIVLRNEVVDTVINMELGPLEIIVDPNYVTMTLNPELGATIDTQCKPGEVTPAVVSFINETNFTLDCNHPLAGKTLLFDITVVGIEKAGK